MDIENIKRSAYEADLEPWRLTRLEQVLGYVCAAADLTLTNNSIFKKVEAVHDNKGYLTVMWKERPIEAEMKLFKEAWESDIGDYSGEQVKHNVITNI